MPWSHPAARMRELILAIRAIWDTWLTGAPLQFRGEFYTHTLMTPFFTPDRDGIEAVGVPRIFLAGVGPAMTEVAGEVADGFICHPFTTERYLREVTLPALQQGRARCGKDLDGFEISGPSFVVTGEQRRRGRRRRSGDAPADRVLRLDPGLPRGARPARLGRAPGRAQPVVQGRRLGPDGRAHRRRDARRVRRRRRTRRGRRRAWRSATATSSRGSRCRYPYRTDPDRWCAVITAIQAI